MGSEKPKPLCRAYLGGAEKRWKMAYVLRLSSSQ